MFHQLTLTLCYLLMLKSTNFDLFNFDHDRIINIISSELLFEFEFITDNIIAHSCIIQI